MESDFVFILFVSFGLIIYCIHLLKKLEAIKIDLKYTKNKLNIYQKSYEDVNKTAKDLLKTCADWRNIYDSLQSYHKYILNNLEKQGKIEIIRETIH